MGYLWRAKIKIYCSSEALAKEVTKNKARKRLFLIKQMHYLVDCYLTINVGTREESLIPSFTFVRDGCFQVVLSDGLQGESPASFRAQAFAPIVRLSEGLRS
jgi:hypothetical protein